DVYKQVRDLSGGEKGRLALAKLIYSGLNVLVLDEPTNHLDIPSREALESALEAYEGTIVTISHDRFFLDRVATQILALDGEGNAEHYNGNYTEYHDWKAARSGPVAVAAESNESEARPSGTATSTRQTKYSGKSRRNRKQDPNSSAEGSRRVKVIKKARDAEIIESEITALEKRISELFEQMTKPEVARDITRLVRVNDDYQRTEN